MRQAYRKAERKKERMTYRQEERKKKRKQEKERKKERMIKTKEKIMFYLRRTREEGGAPGCGRKKEKRQVKKK